MVRITIFVGIYFSCVLNGVRVLWFCGTEVWGVLGLSGHFASCPPACGLRLYLRKMPGQPQPRVFTLCRSGGHERKQMRHGPCGLSNDAGSNFERTDQSVELRFGVVARYTLNLVFRAQNHTHPLM